MSDITELFKLDGIIASETPRVLTFDLHVYFTLVKDRQLYLLHGLITYCCIAYVL